MVRLSFAIIAVLATALDAEAATVKGRVDDAAGKPLKGVLVKISEGDSSVVTGEDGAYRLQSVQTGERTLIFEKLNYIDKPTTKQLKIKPSGETTCATVWLFPKTKQEKSFYADAARYLRALRERGELDFPKEWSRIREGLPPSECARYLREIEKVDPNAIDLLGGSARQYLRIDPDAIDAALEKLKNGLITPSKMPALDQLGSSGWGEELLAHVVASAIVDSGSQPTKAFDVLQRKWGAQLMNDLKSKPTLKGF